MRYLKIESLPSSKSWVDKDIIMLHSCFQLLKDCIEKEHVNTSIPYEFHKEFIDEALFLYKWWKIRSIKVCEQKEDDEMLLRLMKIRKNLWV